MGQQGQKNGFLFSQALASKSRSRSSSTRVIPCTDLHARPYNLLHPGFSSPYPKRCPQSATQSLGGNFSTWLDVRGLLQEWAYHWSLSQRCTITQIQPPPKKPRRGRIQLTHSSQYIVTCCQLRKEETPLMTTAAKLLQPFS